MPKTSNPVVFFGSGPVAARSLELLVRHCPVEAVVTKPRAAHHKGAVPVLDMANKLGVRIYTADSKRSLDELVAAKPFHADLAVLIDFGIIVSQKVIDAFPLGIINSHFSILPEWRGADPITFAVLSGQKQTGVSLMLLTAGMDEGPLIAYGEYDLTPDVTTPTLTEYLINLSDALLTDAIPRHIERARAGESNPSPQAVTGRQESYSRKLTKADSLLDWTKPAEQLEREVRAFLEWPKSRCTLGQLDLVITQAHVIAEERGGTPGTWFIAGALPAVRCGHGALAIDKLKPAGKQEMTGQAFLAGYKRLVINA